MRSPTGLLLLAAILLAAAGCRMPAPARRSEPVYAADDYLRRTQARTFGEFLVGPANLRETGVPPTFQEVADKSTRKLVRGVANVATGWMEIPKQTYNNWYEERTYLSPVVGFGKGVGMAVARELVGVAEVVMPLSPLPSDWEPTIRPEFVFQPEQPRTALRTTKKKSWWRWPWGRGEAETDEATPPTQEPPSGTGLFPEAGVPAGQLPIPAVLPGPGRR
jgi:putative exosortase-associated protein (TIGR04073 family)